MVENDSSNNTGTIEKVSFNPSDARDMRTIDPNRMILILGEHNIISRPNGQARTLKWLKNLGECDLELICLDRDGKPLQYTSQKLAKGGIIESYSSDTNSFFIFVSSVGSGSKCRLELDR